MRFFLDTAKVEDIRKANDMGVICGVTTNPSLIAKEGRNFEEVIAEIASIVDGPISGEVKATTVDAEGMIREGRAIAAIHPNMVVKIPMTVEGLKACKVLSGEFSGDFTDERFRNIDISCHSLLDIFAVTVIFPVKDADTIQTDYIAALESMHVHTLVDDGAFFFNRRILIGKLRDTACIHSYVCVSHDFLCDPICGQGGALVHHEFYGVNCAVIIEPAGDDSYSSQCYHNGYCHAESDFCSNAFHVFLFLSEFFGGKD